jgi:uncharacterized protein YkwD
MGKRALVRLALCATVLLTLVTSAPAQASLRADAASGSSQTGTTVLGVVSLTTPERAVFTLINNARAARGLHRLALRSSLCQAARAHSLSMLRLNYFSHSSASGETYATRILRYGYSNSGCRYWSVGEVLGWGTGEAAGSAKAIFAAWMRSSPHRTVIFASRWRDVGIGRALGTYAGLADVRMFTVDFGRRIY